LASDRAPDARSDVYALATIVFETLARRLPFDSTDAAELAVRRLHHEAPGLHAAGATVPPAIEAWVARGLARSLAVRFADGEVALAAWRAACAELHSGDHVRPGSTAVVLHPGVATRLQQHACSPATGSALILRGEPGIGKSSVLEQFAAWLRGEHRTVLQLRPESSARHAFRDWMSLAAVDPTTLGTRTEAEMQAALLEHLARSFRQPWILVDDPHRLDGATRRLLLRLVSRASDCGVHVVLALDPTCPRPAARALRAALASLGLPEIELAEVSPAAWSSFLGTILEGPSSDALAQHLAEYCGGNPRRACILVEDWCTRGLLRRDGATWVFRPEALDESLPAALDRELSRWQAHLAPLDARILSAAALQGRRFDAHLVAQLVELPADAVWRRLVDLSLHRDLVRRAGDEWEFRTPLLVTWWRARCDPEQRRNGHRRIATALLARPEEDPGRIAIQLASSGDLTAAAPYALRAARTALAAHDPIGVLQVLDVIPECEPTNEAQAEVTSERLRLRAGALQLLAAWDPAVAALERALLWSRAWGLGAAEVEIRVALGGIEYARSRFEEAVAHYLAAREGARARNDEHQRYEVELKLGNIHFECGRLEDATAAYAPALEYATSIGDADLEARAACNIALVESIRGRKQQAIALFDRSLQRFRKLDRPDAVARLHQNIGMIYFELGNWVEARNYFAACMQQCESSGQEALFAVAAVDYAEATIRLGAPAAARAPLLRALAICRERGDELGVASAHRLQGQLASLDGNAAEAEARFEAALRILEPLGQPLQEGLVWRDLGASRLQRGDLAAAREALAPARRLFATLAAPEPAAEVEVLWARCQEVASCR
jgi:tetratricopeptide (TPR) repeat protein